MLIEIKDSPDKRLRREKHWQGIIYHHTGNPKVLPYDKQGWTKWFYSMVEWLSKKDEAYLSAHYVVARDGKICQLVNPETHEAFHAGSSSHWHPEKRCVVTDWNRYAIGIEIIGDGSIIYYTDEQYKALIELSRMLVTKYKLHPLCLLGHENVATPDGRKDDPGPLFDWTRLFKGIYVS